MTVVHTRMGYDVESIFLWHGVCMMFYFILLLVSEGGV